MATLTATDPLLEELTNVEGKAEIVNGQVANFTPAGNFQDAWR